MDNKNKQEENVETFSENVDIKKEKSAKTRKIIGRILRLIIPPFFPFLFLFAGGIAVYSIPAIKDDFGVVAIFFCAFTFVPIYCIIYGRSVAKNEKRKYLFVLYNSIVSFWYYFLGGLYPIIIVAVGWFAFWTLVPIWIHNYNNDPDNAETKAGEMSENGEETSDKHPTGGMAKKMLCLYIVFLASGFLQNLAYSNSVDAFVGSAILMSLLFVVFPLTAFLYSKAFISKSGTKNLESLFCPVVLALSYFVSNLREDETSLFSFIIFAWCEIWSLIGIRDTKKVKSEE